MEFTNRGAEIFIPDGKEVNEALERTTYMAIAAHQDDIEIMAYDGIVKAFGKSDEWFCGVVVTNGSGSPRSGLYSDFTDEQMQEIRKLEQKKAAFVGEYGAQLLLDYPSSSVKNTNLHDVKEELKKLIMIAKPKYIYTHNLADKHDTHVGVAAKVISALRELPEEFWPEKVFGCEVWRNLDWMDDKEKVKFNVEGHPNVEAALVGVFDSQICGGKRYDLATAGRRIANATYSESHGTDDSESLIYAMDLTPLVKDKNLNPNDYVQEYIKQFSKDVASKINSFF
jgi:LmbE family N-acetylglucosaminyl deacetylase